MTIGDYQIFEEVRRRELRRYDIVVQKEPGSRNERFDSESESTAAAATEERFY